MEAELKAIETNFEEEMGSVRDTAQEYIIDTKEGTIDIYAKNFPGLRAKEVRAYRKVFKIGSSS